MGEYNLTVVVEKDEDGNFLAICPALQGCYAEGTSKQEALEMIEDAIRLHIVARFKNNLNLLVELKQAFKDMAEHTKGQLNTLTTNNCFPN